MTIFLELFPIYKYKILGISMSPTLRDGQIIFLNRLSYLFRKPQKGEIIACKDPRDQKILIKRITKIAGDNYFVEGDNKKYSTDSRVFGMIRQSDIIGKVIAP
ncbi:MAG: signal peptidase I [Candidatus Levyibacteriota bacterium]